MTALFLACSHGNYEVMKLLVVAFANVNASARVSLTNRIWIRYEVSLCCVLNVQYIEAFKPYAASVSHFHPVCGSLTAFMHV